MEGRYIAFRFFGTFEWPPVSDLKVYDSRNEGVVEIHYVWDAKQNRYVACVRWIPKAALTESSPPRLAFDTDLSQIPWVYDCDPTGLKANAPFVFRCDIGNKTRKGKVVRFNGARVFDQFGPGANYDDDATRPTLRLPLVRQFDVKEGGQPHRYFSAVQVNSDKSGSLRFDLAVPMAAPQDDEQYHRSTDSYFGAFSAVYQPTQGDPDSKEAGLPADAITFGRRGRSRLPANPLGKAVLGQFPFRWEEEKEDPRTREIIGWGSALWPSAEAVLYSTLPRCGWRVAAKPGKRPERNFSVETSYQDRNKLGDIYPSLTIGGENGRFAVTQRMALRAIRKDDGLDQTASDIRIRSGPVIDVRVPQAGNQWITMDEEVYLSITLEGSIADADVWEMTHKLTGRLWLGCRNDTAPLAPTIEPFAPRQQPLTLVGMLAHAMSAMGLVRLGLNNQSPVSPQSILPELMLDSKDKGSAHLGIGINFKADAREEGSTNIVIDDRRDFPRATLLEGSTINFTAWWPSFHREAANKNVDTPIQLAHDAHGDTHNRLMSVRIVDARATERTAPLTSRLGGFLFTHGKKMLLEEIAHDAVNVSRLCVGPPRMVDAGRPRDNPVRFTGADLLLELRMRVERVEPITAEVPEGSELDDNQALMLPESAPITGNYLLKLTESLGPAAPRRLEATLCERVATTETVASVILYSPQPFSLQRLFSRPLAARGGPEGAEVAYFDSATGQWQILQIDRLYHYVLPPQSIGESMDKPRRLEIHDVEDAESELHRQGFLNPVTAGSDGLRRRAVEFRLTPPADLWMAPVGTDRNYYLPEWATGGIFGLRQDARGTSATGDMGAPLAALRAEFLYGLAIGIDPSAESGPSRSARVADIQALTGRTVERKGELEWYEDRWRRLRRAIDRRPQRLEIWADRPDATVSFAPARFRDGARFALRTTALLRPPVKALEDEILSTGKPAQAGPAAPRLHPLGLSGGALWPVESRNVLDMILAEPASSGGEIDRIALATLGGSADQKARFCNNRVAIISETRDGYVQRHQIEVIGHIAVFWHKAKHVVVYERTANPSAQFTPEEDLGTRTRRPVLRKVAEYIEILQPERRYPDNAVGTTQPSAFLRALRFNHHIIPVDSSWAEDVGKSGWKVPLWNLHAAVTRPQVYPRPDVAFLTACEGPGEAPEAAQECLNPDNIFFFTDTSSGPTDDTDAWSCRPLVDYVSHPPCSSGWPDGQQRAAQSSETPPGVPASSARQVPLGYERFTWFLAPPAQRTAVNAGRANKPVYAALETITFMRGPRTASSVAHLDVLRAAATLESLPVTPIASLWRKGEAVDERAPAALRTAAAAVNGIKLPPFPIDDGTREQVKADLLRIKTEVAALATHQSMQDAAASFVEQIKIPLEQMMATAPDPDPNNRDPRVVKPPQALCEQLQEKLKTGLSAKRLSLLQELHAWETAWHQELQDTRDQTWEALKSPDELKNWIVKEVRHALAPAYGSSSIEVGKFRRSIACARAAIVHAKEEAGNCVKDARRRFEEVRGSIQYERPWSPARVADFQKQLDVAALQAIEHLRSIVTDARHRLLADMDELARPAATLAARALEEGTRQFTEAGQAVTGQIHAFQDALAQVRKAVAGVLLADGPVDRARATLEAEKDQAAPDQKQKFDDALQAVDAVAARMKALLGNLDKLDLRAEALAGDISDEIKAAAEACREAFGHLGADVADAQAKLKDLAASLSKDKLDELLGQLDRARVTLDAVAAKALDDFENGGRWVNCYIDSAVKSVAALIEGAAGAIGKATAFIDEGEKQADAELKKVETMLEPETLVNTLFDTAWKNANISERLANSGLLGAAATLTDKTADLLTDIATDLVKQITELLQAPDNFIDDIKKQIKTFCNSVGDSFSRLESTLTKKAEEFIQPFQDKVTEYEQKLFGKLDDLLSDANKYATLIEEFGKFEADTRAIVNDLARAGEMARAYARDVVDAVGRTASSNAESLPGNVLRAMAAAGAAPELPNLHFERLRINYFHALTDDIVDITPVEAWFGRLGDELKAMGINLLTDRIGDTLVAAEQIGRDLSSVFQWFSGLRLDQLSSCGKLPSGLANAIKISHDFDQKRFRAWVQVDVDLPLPERRSLLTVGPFSLDMLNAQLTGRVRLEADKDHDKVEQTGYAILGMDLEAVVAGQPMVTLQKVAVHYDRGGGLHVEFDPKNVKLNPTFEFVQSTLQSLIPDQVGCMEVIKRDGMPVGLQHVFALPPMGFMGATTGVTNLTISNRFKLVAYPDFVIANRFSLATPEQPFIFSFFIVGGTGWLSVDVEYRPFGGELLVVVEAAAGGSAALGFAFAGCSGSVAITFSAALTYRRLIGQPGGGLTVSLVLVVFGVVDVLSIASAYIGVVMRLSYRENGEIFATGSFRVTIRISRFFSVSTGGDAHYPLAGGRSNAGSGTRRLWTAGTDTNHYKKAEKLLASMGD